MKLERYKNHHYSLLEDMWGEYTPKKTSLPKFGVCLFDDDFKGAAFVATTDTDYCILTWWNVKSEKPYKHLMALIEACKLYVQSIGMRYLFIYSDKRGMIKLLTKCGFCADESHGTHMRWENNELF